MRYKESVYKSLEETRREQLNQAEILYYRSMNAEITIIQRMLQKLSTVVSQCFDDAPQSARGVFDYTKPASKYDPDQRRDDLGRFALVGGSGSPGKGEMDIKGAVNHLNAIADPGPPGKKLCATYVREAIEKGGKVTLENHPIPAYKYDGYLDGYFDKLPTPPPDYTPKTGDIAVFQPPPEQKEEPKGHIQMYNGKEWVSDFKQGEGKRHFWPGPDYRDRKPPIAYVIYRPRDWKPPENV